jgi:hypothetical protein
MEKLLEWLKANVKDGADMNEATRLVDEIATVTPERAAELVKDREVRRILDAEISRAVERHDERFREEKLPKILEEERGKIRKEFNPEETPEQKAVRELQEKLAAMEREKAAMERKAALRAKASELGVDAYGLKPDDVEVFAGLGDDAERVLARLTERLSESFNSALDSKVKERYTKTRPSGGDPNMDEVAKLRAAGNDEQAQRLHLQSIYQNAKREK